MTAKGDADRQKHIKEMTALFKKLEIKDIEVLLKAAKKKYTNIPVSKAVSDKLASAIGPILKLPFMSRDCTWKYRSSPYKQLRPELSFEVQRSSGSSALNRIVVIEIDEGYHRASSYTNQYAIISEFYRNFVYLRKAGIHYRPQKVLVDIVRAGFEKHDVVKKSVKDRKLIKNLIKYVSTLLQEDLTRAKSTIRFWNYPADNPHISHWRRSKEVDTAKDTDPLCTAAFELKQVHLDKVKLQIEGN